MRGLLKLYSAQVCLFRVRVSFIRFLPEAFIFQKIIVSKLKREAKQYLNATDFTVKVSLNISPLKFLIQ